MTQGFEYTQVLLDRVVKAMEFLSRSILKTGCFEYHAYMGLVVQTWSIISQFEAVNRFGIVLTGSRQPFDDTFRSAVLECMLKVNKLFRVGKHRSVMNRDTKLLPEHFPTKDVSIKGGNVKFREFDTLCDR